MAQLLLLNGPNLNLLGEREPDVYGTQTLADIELRLSDIAKTAGHELCCYQSNAEHGLVDRIQQAAADGVSFILFNPAGYTHTSVALRDAMLAVNIPFIEIHLSNTAAREEFRQHSYFSDIAVGSVSGFGALSYELAMQAASEYLHNPGSKKNR